MTFSVFTGMPPVGSSFSLNPSFIFIDPIPTYDLFVLPDIDDNGGASNFEVLSFEVPEDVFVDASNVPHPAFPNNDEVMRSRGTPPHLFLKNDFSKPPLSPDLTIWDDLLSRAEDLSLAYDHHRLRSEKKIGLLKQGNQLAVSLMQQALKFLDAHKKAPNFKEIQEIMELAGNIIQGLHAFFEKAEKDVSVEPAMRTLLGSITNSYIRFLVDMELLTMLEDEPEAFLDSEIMSRIEALANKKSIGIPGVPVHRWHVEIANNILKYLEHTFHLGTVRRFFQNGKIMITGQSQPNSSYPSKPFVITFFERMLGWESTILTHPDGSTTIEIQI